MAMDVRVAAPLLEARRISKFFGAITALNNVNFHVDPGEVLGVVGDNGAGKSTLMKILSGLYTPAKASLCFRAQPCASRARKTRVISASRWSIRISRWPGIWRLMRTSIWG